MNNKYLSRYLRDHFAAAMGGIELARHLWRHNEGNLVGDAMEDILVELIDERQALEHIMDRLDIPHSRVKSGAMWVAEKLGRFKFNGVIAGYSPLNRLDEIEAMSGAIRTRCGLWRTTQAVAKLYPALNVAQAQQFEHSALEQLSCMDTLHDFAVQKLILSSDSASQSTRPH